MNTINKRFFILSLLMLVCLSACGLNNRTEVKLQRVNKAASEIADFDLPADYRPDFSAALLGYSLAAYSPGDGRSHLYLLQAEKAADREMFGKMLAQLAPGYNDPASRMTVLDKMSVIVRGAEGLLVVSEGINSENMTYRQVSLTFQGKGGPAMLVLSEPVSKWDQEIVDSFLGSIQ